MLAATFEVLRTIDWNVVVIHALTTSIFALNFPINAFKIVVIFIGMIAKTLGRSRYSFT